MLWFKRSKPVAQQSDTAPTAQEQLIATVCAALDDRAYTVNIIRGKRSFNVNGTNLYVRRHTGMYHRAGVYNKDECLATDRRIAKAYDQAVAFEREKSVTLALKDLKVPSC